MSYAFADGIRCYECRSDTQQNCGDPFFKGNIIVKNCDESFTTSARSTMCFKISQYGKAILSLIIGWLFSDIDK